MYISLIVSAVIIEFSPATYIVPEGENRALRIVKLGESEVNVSVLISTVDGTAMGRLKLRAESSPHSHCSDDCVSVSLPAPSDYTSIPAVNVTFAPEQTEQLVLLTTIPDSTVEGRESLSAVLSDASAGVTIRRETANITITEDTCKLYLLHCILWDQELFRLSSLFLQWLWWSLNPLCTLSRRQMM